MLLSFSSPNIDRFKKSLTDALFKAFVKIPPHLKHVVPLPCEILMPGI